VVAGGRSHPGFRDFCDRTGIQFQPHESFLKIDIEERQKVYRKIADEIWNPLLLQS